MASDFSRTKLNTSIYTSNGMLDVVMPHRGMGTVDTPLFFLDAATSNAQATMYLHNDYEGTFDLETTSGTASVILDTDQRDDKGRNRVVDMDRANERTHKAGKTYWGEELPKSDQGDIRIRTTQKDVVISNV